MPDGVTGTAPARSGGPTILADGFRPFFLCAGLYGALAVPLWLLVFYGIAEIPFARAGAVGHGHEMLLGFVAAAVAGFLLTAVPNWTGRAALRGAALGVLVALWLAGRIAWWAADMLESHVVAAADLAFIPALLVAVGRPVLAARKPGNLVVLAIIAGLFAANLLVHLDRVGVMEDGAATGLTLAVYTVALLLTIIGGRVTPAFTANALRQAGDARGIRSIAPLDGGCIAGSAAVLVLVLAAPGSTVLGIVAALAALLHAARLAGWRGWRTVRQPILLVLHLGYAWLPVGYGLLAGACLTDAVPATAPVHALTAGAAGTMILAVMTRAALGHTGRPLVAPPLAVAAYALVTLGAAGRLIAPLAPGAAGVWTMAAAGACWAGAYALFSIAYWPILWRPRVDGTPG